MQARNLRCAVLFRALQLRLASIVRILHLLILTPRGCALVSIGPLRTAALVTTGAVVNSSRRTLQYSPCVL